MKRTPEQKAAAQKLIDEFNANFAKQMAEEEAKLAVMPKLYDAKNGDYMPEPAPDDGIPPDLPTPAAAEKPTAWDDLDAIGKLFEDAPRFKRESIEQMMREKPGLTREQAESWWGAAHAQIGLE